MMTAKIYIIHENPVWAEPLKAELEKAGLPHQDWFMDRGMLNVSRRPPQGVFYNRMSASAHTRQHIHAPAYAAAVLNWLESHGRRAVNKSRALQLEVSKAAQYAALRAEGILTPCTVAAFGREEVVEAAREFRGPFVIKHNCGGKGLGVRLFKSLEALKDYVEGPEFESPVDGITLVQEYIDSPEPFIVRCEFIGGRFFYALRVDTSEGFQLCPADACDVDEAFCPAGDRGVSRFKILKGFKDEILKKYESFLAKNDIEIAGIEFIRNSSGKLYTYDINTNTNYNTGAEAEAGIFALEKVAAFLGGELEKVK